MDSVYNSPPNWPSPPVGWRPPPGWAPDPNWPAPPQNWAFWVAAPAAPPTGRKPSLWLTVGLPVTAVILIIVLGTTGAAIALVKKLDNAVGPARDAVGSYAQALQDQRYDAAFAMRCPERAGDHDDFVALWSNRNSAGLRITGFKIVQTKTDSLDGTTVARVNLKMYFADGSERNEWIPLTKAGETWRPCN